MTCLRFRVFTNTPRSAGKRQSRVASGGFQSYLQVRLETTTTNASRGALQRRESQDACKRQRHIAEEYFCFLIRCRIDSVSKQMLRRLQNLHNCAGARLARA